jgi:hypothetical protein
MDATPDPAKGRAPPTAKPTCSKCQKPLSAQRLPIHESTCKGPSGVMYQFLCPICQENFYSKQVCARHITRKHFVADPYPLLVHQRRHKDPKRACPNGCGAQIVHVKRHVQTCKRSKQGKGGSDIDRALPNPPVVVPAPPPENVAVPDFSSCEHNGSAKEIFLAALGLVPVPPKVMECAELFGLAHLCNQAEVSKTRSGKRWGYVPRNIVSVPFHKTK